MEKSGDLAASGTDKPTAAAARTATSGSGAGTGLTSVRRLAGRNPDEADISRAGARSPGGLASRCTPFPVHEDDPVRVDATLVCRPPVFTSFACRFDTTVPQ